jgi:UDPglucose 6-dehydrogenase
LIGIIIKRNQSKGVILKITIIGTGYVGLVTGACFSEMGSTVTCIDVDKKRIENLKRGIIPIFEPGLENIVKDNQDIGLLKFSTSIKKSCQDSDIFFIAVGTPSGEDGSADLQYVLKVAKEIGGNIDGYTLIVNKSTVPVGTADKVKQIIGQELQKRKKEFEFDVVSNPEFLKEGTAVNDFLKPDRIIIGCNSTRSATLLTRLYAPFSRNRDKIIFMNVRDAEMTKYAANSMLATKISFMNEISNICERLGVDVENVRKGIGSDSRIGYSFIYPGCGYGGSCFPKDVRALINTSLGTDFTPMILNAVEKRNNAQKQILGIKIKEKFGDDLSNKKFGLWGLSFKPGTDDVREASSMILIKDLITAGALIKAYDPVAIENLKQVLPSSWIKDRRIVFTENQYKALENVNAMVLLTEWKTFRQPDFKLMIEMMVQPVIFDGRNLYDPEQVKEAGMEYNGIGRESA